MDTGSSHHPSSSGGALEITILVVQSFCISHNTLEEGDESVPSTAAILESPAENSDRIVISCQIVAVACVRQCARRRVSSIYQRE